MIQCMAILKLTALESEGWTYRGEGRRGFVVANNNGLVLKLTKVLPFWRPDTYLSHYITNYQYVKLCIAPLFGPLLCFGQVVEIPPSFTTKVVSRIKDRRTSLKESSIDYHCPYGLLMPDACSLGNTVKDIITIEIKPKACFRTAADKTLTSKYPCCRFCSTIESRHSNGHIRAVTRYCPRDMFSGGCRGVSVAVSRLLDEPLSYLTVHWNGRRVFDEDRRDITAMLAVTGFRDRAEFVAIVTQVLLAPLHQGKTVLAVIEDAQLCNSLSLAELNEVDRIFVDAGLDLDTEIAKWVRGHSELDPELSEMIQHVINFTISVIAQDLSVMISLARTASGIRTSPGPRVSYKNQEYKFKVSVVDVELKSVKKLPMYLKQEQREIGLMIESKREKER